MARSQDAVADLEERVARIDARVGAAREQVRELAVRLYVEGTVPLTRILRMADANDVVRAQQYSSVLAATTTDALGRFRADREDLVLEQAALDDQQEAHAATVDDLRQRQDDAMEEIDRLARS